MRKLIGNKKGSLIDIIFVAGIALAFGMIMLLGFKFMSELNTELQAQDIIDVQGKTAANQLTDIYPTAVDNSFLLLIVGLAIGAFVLAALVRVSPIFLALYFLALGFVIFMSAVMSNIYQEMAANANLIAQADQLMFTSSILTYLPLIVGVFGSLLALVMYKSWRDAQGI